MYVDAKTFQTKQSKINYQAQKFTYMYTDKYTIYYKTKRIELNYANCTKLDLLRLSCHTRDNVPAFLQVIYCLGMCFPKFCNC